MKILKLLITILAIPLLFSSHFTKSNRKTMQFKKHIGRQLAASDKMKDSKLTQRAHDLRLEIEDMDEKIRQTKGKIKRGNSETENT